MQVKPVETSPELLEAIERAREHVMTPREIWLQRLSFVYGQCWNSTREQVEEALTQIYGPCPEETKDDD